MSSEANEKLIGNSNMTFQTLNEDQRVSFLFEISTVSFRQMFIVKDKAYFLPSERTEAQDLRFTIF